jgi:crotonobetainyl-CoA:carnitine CoA-transferase CaiB-like acyl-CoA transferase
MPIKFSDTKIDKTKEAPVFGEHTKQILLENGFSSEEVDNLIKQSVVL